MRVINLCPDQNPSMFMGRNRWLISHGDTTSWRKCACGSYCPWRSCHILRLFLFVASSIWFYHLRPWGSWHALTNHDKSRLCWASYMMLHVTRLYCLMVSLHSCESLNTYLSHGCLFQLLQVILSFQTCCRAGTTADRSSWHVLTRNGAKTWTVSSDRSLFSKLFEMPKTKKKSKKQLEDRLGVVGSSS